MKLKLAIFILFFTFILKGQSSSDLIFNDDFYSNVNNWYEGSDSKRAFSVRDGYYYFEHKLTTGSWLTSQNVTVDVSKDYKIESTIKKISGVTNSGYGLDWGTVDNYYEFMITDSGYFAVYQFTKNNNQFVALKPWATTTYVNKGEDSSNTLMVTKVGKVFNFYVNDTLVFSDASYANIAINRMGYVVNQNQKIAIDNLKATYLSSGEQFAFNDQFDSNKSYWPIWTSGNLITYFQNGSYYFNQTTKTDGEYAVTYAPTDTSKDFQIETEMTKISGEDNSGYGLVFGRKDAKNQYLFNIATTGFYRISKYENGTYTNLIDWKTGTSINKTLNQSNKLTVKKENNKYRFFINDIFVDEIPFTPFFGNNIGYVAFTTQKFANNYLTISYLSGKKDVIVNNNNTNNKIIVTNNNITNDDKDAKDYLIYENFNDNSNAWVIGDTDTYSAAISNGKYRLEHKRETSGWYWGKNKAVDQNRDFKVETTFERETSANSSIAFVFGRKDDKNKYELFISTGGSYLLRKYVEGEKTILIDWTESPYIATGTAPNLVGIQRSGDQGRIFINNQLVNKFDMPTIPGIAFGWVVYGNTAIKVDDFKLKYLQEDFNNPPEIEIIEPQVVSRGFKIVKTKSIKVIGKATDKDGIFEVKINGIEAYVSANGEFNADVPLKYGDNELIVTASDIKGKSATKNFYFKRESPVIVDNNNNNNNNNDDNNDNVVTTKSGAYYALLIGVSEYGDSKIQDLEGLPNKDAEGLGTILKTFYNFKPENIKVLVNAKRTEILNAFDDLQRKLTDEDNLLIFYAGHGVYEEDAEVGYWLPSDADKNYTANWIQNSVVVSNIKRIKSKHTLLISDACFSGSIFKDRALTEDAPTAFKQLYELPSKRAITSGTLKTVPNKSVFYKYLTDRLTNNKEKYMSALDLFSAIKTPVANNSSTIPQYGVIHGIGDEGGDFIFIKK